MKKKLAFVIPSLDAGGGEKSLVNLLNAIDPAQYEVDLILFHKRGLFLKSVPAHVRILEPGTRFAIFGLGLAKSLLKAALRLDFGLFAGRLQFALKNKRIKNANRAEQFSWPHMASTMDPIDGTYDAAIGFLEKSSVYFAVDKINAKKKIGFIHTNYLDMGMDADFDRRYFGQLDAIVTVSDECANVLKQVFPEFSSRVTIVHNVVSPKLIRQMAESGSAPEISTPTILSVGRLHPLKGFDLAVEACAILVQKGFSGKWIVIGDGSERESLERQIAQHNLSGHFKLIGLRENPYPYVAAADVYVQPSRVEGKSIAIDEAKILAKPIVVTNFATVADQITDGQTGLVSEMTAESLAENIMRLIEDQALRNRLAENLSGESLGTESEVLKLYDIIDQ